MGWLGGGGVWRLPARVIVSLPNNNKVLHREEPMKGLARLAVVAALAFAPATARADMKALEEPAKKEGALTGARRCGWTCATCTTVSSVARGTPRMPSRCPWRPPPRSG